MGLSMLHPLHRHQTSALLLTVTESILELHPCSHVGRYAGDRFFMRPDNSQPLISNHDDMRLAPGNDAEPFVPVATHVFVCPVETPKIH